MMLDLVEHHAGEVARIKMLKLRIVRDIYAWTDFASITNDACIVISELLRLAHMLWSDSKRCKHQDGLAGMLCHYARPFQRDETLAESSI